MSAHTPGPWAVVRRGKASYVTMFIGKDGLPDSATGEAEFPVQPYCRPDEAAANAALIAAAPDLFAALATLVAALDWEEQRSGTTYNGHEQARAALERAS